MSRPLIEELKILAETSRESAATARLEANRELQKQHGSEWLRGLYDGRARALSWIAEALEELVSTAAGTPCPLGEALARSDRGLRQAVRRGLAAAGIYDDDIERIADRVLEEIEREVEQDGDKRNAAR